MKVLKSTNEFQEVLEIDENIHRLVGNLELLAFINPLNIAQERKRFFKEKFKYNPQFKYRKVRFDTYKLHRLFFSQRLKDIDDKVIRDLYKDVVYTYSGMVQCIETISQPDNRFYFNSLRFYGTPTDKMVENAKFILHHKEDDNSTFAKADSELSTEQAIAFFEDYKKEYEFDFAIKTSNAMSAAAMVSNNDRALILKKNHLFSQHQLNVLAHHEIGVHLVTTFNAIEQQLKIFGNGFPNNVETQEGLAVFAEYMSGNLNVTRLRELAYRVIATDSLIKGNDFTETFNLIHNQYGLDREKAFNITLRVHRGGGFTKDALYLSGLQKIYNRYQSGEDMESLLMGKCSLEYLSSVKRLEEVGLAKPITHICKSYNSNNNKDQRVEWILQNLK
ncbi:conserved hypothetical protein [Nonlabens sp. Hel1_33_55]|uniref:flavohemoglobin expression-modulating QEGLA motif protein n=1 Tax=Nonlabens sp. Hel1_33_55 TaxID=1336802 RepID=UPI000875DFFA|nr:tyrosine/phenylalanine carboxypeptidase domain-containing protein [Nonlabens sp. Hel1_33_55]SCY05733.1 conserved hypothetical protein [Nonlabens sp. Hel1_33_55]